MLPKYYDDSHADASHSPFKDGNKADAGGARKLAQLLRAGVLQTVYHGSRSMWALLAENRKHAGAVRLREIPGWGLCELLPGGARTDPHPSRARRNLWT